MRTVRQLAIEVEVGLRVVHLTLRKTVIAKLALAVGAALEAQTPNTAELAHRLPLDTERQDMREQWLRRLSKNPLSSADFLEPWTRQALVAASAQGERKTAHKDERKAGLLDQPRGQASG
jgi:hypothetical protein